MSTTTRYTAIASGLARRWEITGSLDEGYTGYDRGHTLQAVERAHRIWQEREGLILGALLTPATVLYGIPWHGAVRAAYERGWILSGVISTLYDADLSDEEALTRVLSLAAFLADQLSQQRIYAVDEGTQHILERAEGTAKEEEK